MRFWDGSGISWDYMQTICTSLQTENHTNTSSLKSLQAGCSSWCRTTGVKALKAIEHRVDRKKWTRNWRECTVGWDCESAVDASRDFAWGIRWPVPDHQGRHVVKPPLQWYTTALSVNAKTHVSAIAIYSINMWNIAVVVEMLVYKNYHELDTTHYSASFCYTTLQMSLPTSNEDIRLNFPALHHNTHSQCEQIYPLVLVKKFIAK